MNSSLLEQYHGLLSNKFRLPPLIEEETDEVDSLVNKKFCRLNQMKNSLIGIIK